MSFGTWLHTTLKGKCVGKDIFGNRYFVEKKAKSGRQKRWVMYNGMAEPSKIPPLWHGWLHHTIDQMPDELNMPSYGWMKEHIPNLTGTRNAYRPDGSLSASAKRDSSVSDYQPWTPGN